ncbi:MAG: hypothetical protein HN738_01950 [Gammaproteobacteria bacterium]|jgi:hypothetical protein|nr:hypothetical protein [Gammaproteobacteria bacterium]
MNTELNKPATSLVNKTLNLALWTGAWLLATALAVFGPQLAWDFQTSLTLAAVTLQLAAGGGMALACVQHLRGLDELQRKIQLDATGATLIAGMVMAGSYQILEEIRLITFQPEISHLMVAMAFTYMCMVFRGYRRYQ